MKITNKEQLKKSLSNTPKRSDQGEVFNQNSNDNWDWSMSSTGKAVEAARNVIKAQTPPLKMKADADNLRYSASPNLPSKGFIDKKKKKIFYGNSKQEPRLKSS